MRVYNTQNTRLLSEKKKKKKRDAVESFLDERPTSTISAAVYLSWKCARESGRQTNEKSDSAWLSDSAQNGPFGLCKNVRFPREKTKRESEETRPFVLTIYTSI